jgi:3-carboxy-cis,cis-muconate cycloisomerase
MSATPFDSHLLSGLLGDEEAASYFTAEAELREMILFEEALALAEGEEGIIPVAAASFIADQISTFEPDIAAIRNATARDGVIGVEFVRQLRDWVGAPHGAHVHFGATSQDLVDTALVRRLRPLLAVLEQRIEQVLGALDHLDHRFGGQEIMARTRMQDAIAIHASDRIASWCGPLRRDLERLHQLAPRLLVLQFGGAAGTLDKLGDRGPAVAARLAEKLNLGMPPGAWHSQRDNLAEFGGWLSMVSGSLGKIGVDIGLMAQNRAGEIALSGTGASSAMAHKANPVAAEVLVALARHNATLVGGMHQALVHEQERSGAAWTLEWLTLPQMAITTAASLRTAHHLLHSVTRMGAA